MVNEMHPFKVFLSIYMYIFSRLFPY